MIRLDKPFWDIPELVETLGSLSRLQRASLPSSVIEDARVWDALGNLPGLRALSASDDPAARTLRMALDDVHPSLAFGNRFPSLTDLDLFAPLPTVITLFTSSQPRDTTSNIALRVYDEQGAPCTMWDLNSAIPSKAPQLGSLCIASYVQDMQIKLSDITPLFPIHSLRVLRMCTNFAALLTDDNYATVAASLPQIRVLEITPAPMSMELTPPPATLLTLSHVAYHCQQIEELAVYVDTAIDRLPGTDVSLSVFTQTLTHINFGLSPVHSRRAAAYPLSRMLSQKVPEIVGGEGWNVDGDWWMEEETQERLERAYDDWATVHMVVQQLLPFVDAVRQDAPPQRTRPDA